MAASGEQNIEGVKKLGRIVYVDPNDVFGHDSTNRVPFTPPYEDMCIAFNLIIEKYDRFDAHIRKEIGMEWTDKPNGQNSTYFSVLRGELESHEQNYLTTYYTEISADGYKKKEKVEGLGVTSIQVNFDSYYTPTVTINFVDVRGSALFGREEAIHSNATGRDAINADNIFGAFFTIPYPKFRLQIKGFYGKDVTYQLTCSNFKAKFNSKTGNVEATVSFVGYTWSLLTDIPLSYLIAAPYCNYEGQRYWRSRESDSAWQMENAANTSASKITPPTLFEFFNSIRSCIKKNGEVVKGSGGNISSTITDKKTLLNNIISTINQFEGKTSSKKKADIDANSEEIKRIFGVIKESCMQGIVMFNDLEFPQEAFSENTKTNGDEYEIADFKPIKDKANTQLQAANKETDELIKKERQQFVADSLKEIGIDPNIKNIFKILMCHLETFCHILFKAGEDIKAQAAAGQRAPTILGVGLNNTDIPEMRKVSALPAWTAIFREDSEEVISSDELKYSEMYQWVGNISNNWLEEYVVWSLQNAIQHTALAESKEETAKEKKLSLLPILGSDFNLESNIFSNILLTGFDCIVGNLGLRAAQIFGVMDTTLSNNIDIVKILGEIDAYNFFMCCRSIDDIKSTILERIGNRNATEVLAGITTCNTTYDREYCSKDKSGSTYYTFELNPYHKLSVENGYNVRQPIFAKSDNFYKYIYFYDVDNKVLIPSHLAEFKDKGYEPYIKLKENENWYEGVVNTDQTTNGWLNTDNAQIANYKNYDMFSIIDDESTVNMILKKYEEIKGGDFKVKNYSVNNAEGFKKITDRYWNVSYDTYKKRFPDELSCTFIGKTYSTYFGVDKPQPLQNYWINDKATWSIALDGAKSLTKYPLGSDYDKIKIDDNDVKIDELFIKSLYVYNKDGSSTGSLFGHPFYYTQNQIKDDTRRRNAKAFLFLQSLARAPKTNDIFDASYGKLTITTKLNALYIGGLLWRQKFYNENKVDGILYTNGIPNYEIYVNKNGNLLTMGDTYGLNISKERGGLNKKAQTISAYLGASKLGLDNNIKTQLIEYFEDFAKTSFLTIARKCEISRKDNGKITPFSDGSSFHLWLTTNFNQLKKDKLLSPDVSKICGGCYAFFYTNQEVEEANGVYMLFDEKESQEVQNIIKDIYFGKVIIMSSSAMNKAKNGVVTIPANVYESYLTSFVDTLRTIHTSQTTGVDEYQSTDLTENIEQNENMLLAIYLYCKNVWEKWLLPLSETDITKNNGQIIKGTEYFNIEHWFENFVFIDSYYNDIGKLLKINLDVLLKSYEGRSENGSLFSFIGDIVAEHRSLFVGLPDYVHLGLGINGENSGGLQKMKEMFMPMPYNKMGVPRMDNHFVVIYTYPPSSQLPDELSHKFDGFDIYATDVLPKFFQNASVDDNIKDSGVTKYGYNVPAFGIAFGKQNNHLFKDFNISMDNPVETEQSIKTLYHVAELAKGSDRKVCFYGQDIYNIFSNYSYQIEVEMMGNAQIQPLMYFQLLNIPMWRGAYMIFNVSHTMTPGNMVTRFKGMKMSKRPVPILSSYWSFIKEADSGSGTDGSVSSDYSGTPYALDLVEQVNPGEGGDRDNTINMLWGGTDWPHDIPYAHDNNDKAPEQIKNQIVEITIKGRDKNGKPITHKTHMHRLLKEKIEHIFDEIFNLGAEQACIYGVGSPSGFQWRHVINGTSTTSPSNHAFGSAIDINVPNNGYVAYDKQKDDKFTMRSYEHPIVKTFAKYGFRWGGRYNGGPTNSGKHDYMHFEYYIPKGKKYNLNPPSVGDGTFTSASGGKSIFSQNLKYNFNAVCQPQGKFDYTFDNIKKCVLYFVAHGEGGLRRWNGRNYEKGSNTLNPITDYCGLAKSSDKNPNANNINPLFFTNSTINALSGYKQGEFCATLDDQVFNYYFNNYYKPYKDFLEKCRNPFTRYVGILALKAGVGYYNNGWSAVGGKDMSKLSDLSYTSNLASAWITQIKSGYGTGNKVYWASVDAARQYNRIY